MTGYQDLLVAQFLKDKGYLKTLATFTKESKIQDEEVKLIENYPTLEKIIDDRYPEGISFNEEIIEEPIDQNTITIQELKEVQLNKGIMALNAEFSNNNNKEILISANDKILRIFNNNGELILQSDKLNMIFKSFIHLIETYYIAGGMDGKIYLIERVNNEKLIMKKTFPGHRRVITIMKFMNDWNFEDGSIGSLITIGLDNFLNVFSINKEYNIELINSFKFISLPIDFLNMNYKSSINHHLIIVSRSNSTTLTILQITKESIEEILRVPMIDAVFSSHEFNAMALSLSNNKNNNFNDANLPIINVATSHIPYMRLLVIKLPELKHYIKNNIELNNDKFQEINFKNTVQGQILININTNVLQDKYSTALIKKNSLIDKEMFILDDNEGSLKIIDISKNSFNLKNNIKVVARNDTFNKFKCFNETLLQNDNKNLMVLTTTKGQVYILKGIKD